MHIFNGTAHLWDIPLNIKNDNYNYNYNYKDQVKGSERISFQSACGKQSNNHK